MYTFQSRIRYSEIDPSGVLTPEGLINYFQDCSTFQSEDAGCGVAWMEARGIAWIVASWQIEIARLPRLGEEIVTGTLPYELKGAFGLRNFFMETTEGERLATANSVWLLMNMERRFPSRVTKEMIEGYPLEERLPMEYLDRKIALPEDAEAIRCPAVTIREHHLDTNAHVNNGQYIRIAMSVLMQLLEKEGISEHEIDARIRRIRAEYKEQAHLGDILHPHVFTFPEKAVHTISLEDETGKPYCIVELSEKA